MRISLFFMCCLGGPLSFIICFILVINQPQPSFSSFNAPMALSTAIQFHSPYHYCFSQTSPVPEVLYSSTHPFHWHPVPVHHWKQKLAITLKPQARSSRCQWWCPQAWSEIQLQILLLGLLPRAIPGTNCHRFSGEYIVIFTCPRFVEK